MKESTYETLSIDILTLDLHNPRIRQYMDMYGDNVTAEGIALALSGSGSSESTTSFSSLKESIRVHRGIIHPIIVNHTTADNKYIVIEGNTRLQIYKDFYKKTQNKIWEKIRCVVYENLEKNEVDAIRLQSHLVGPRDWDPYSKAQYLTKLYHEDGLPLNTIIDYCGGKKGVIMKLIEAYHDMQTFYVQPLLEGDKPDVREFSKFHELQNRSIKIALNENGFSEVDFGKWVFDGNIDTAQNVRWLPDVLKDEAARKEFLKTDISHAITKLNTASSKDNIDLKSVPYGDLCNALILKLRNMPYEEIKRLRKGEEEIARHNKNLLIDLREELEELISDIEGE